jgi:hypothetical protein
MNKEEIKKEVNELITLIRRVLSKLELFKIEHSDSTYKEIFKFLKKLERFSSNVNEKKYKKLREE